MYATRFASSMSYTPRQTMLGFFWPRSSGQLAEERMDDMVYATRGRTFSVDVDTAMIEHEEGNLVWSIIAQPQRRPRCHTASGPPSDETDRVGSLHTPWPALRGV